MAAETPENKAKKAIERLVADLKRLYPTRHFADAVLRRNPASTMGGNGRPDMTLVMRGLHIDIEVKAARNAPTKLQVKWMDETVMAGGFGFVIWGDHPKEMEWLKTMLMLIDTGDVTPDSPYLQRSKLARIL